MGHGPSHLGGARRPPQSDNSSDLFGRDGQEEYIDYHGVQVPAGPRHGRGRLYIEAGDHKVTYGEEQVAPKSVETGRRSIIPFDHMKHQVMRPIEEMERVKPIEDQEMKNAVKEWCETVQTMIIFDYSKWEDVVVKPKGCHWVAEACNERRQSLSREGPSARALAEKLAMMPVAELRFFGLRFAGANEIRRPEVRPVKGRAQEDNPTLVSPGMHHIMNKEHHGLQGSTAMSNARKEPDAVQRRYISSGKAHFDGSTHMPNDPAPTELYSGRAKGDCFDGGIARGIGRGKRHIEKPDSVSGLFGGGPWAS